MKNIYTLVVFSITIYLFAFAMPGSSQDTDNNPMINLMITPDLPASPTGEQVTAARDDFVNIYNTLSSRKLAGTIYLSSDVTSSPIALFLAQLGLYTNLEFAMSGSNSEEKLSAMPYSEQLKALKKAKTQTEACRVCGKNEIMVNGFRPQFYDQNEDTYKALDELGIAYDAGFG
jgi:hypothetical protein